ncbi:ligase-associated DNA damage response endonuclease PdeM [Glaciecola sp. 1036]|uniref:ligase-associated DNA damage response endonuclease PdeM n=1 Tax=Alteromonadaceae TaxID=72275 RepID=UPI003CFC6B5F
MIDEKQLVQLVQNNQSIPVQFADQRLLLDAEGVLYWPQCDLLIFSDLHFEKGSFLTQFAHPVPRYDSIDTLKRIQASIARYKPSTVVCLGDSLHDVNAVKRMEDRLINHLNELISSVDEWCWVLGNHDPDIPESLFGLRMNFFTKNNLLLVHEFENLENHKDVNGQIIGHFHPKVSARIAMQKITGKCFLQDHKTIVMPAFGKYTGGLDLKNEAFSTILDKKNTKNFLMYNKKIYLV